MSDALNDLCQDDKIREAFDKLIKKEEKFLSEKRNPKNSKTDVISLMKDWEEYAYMRRGYFTSTSMNTSGRHIVGLGRWLEGRISYGELKENLNEKEDENSMHTYFAVGGHGQMMNNMGEFISTALRKKFGDRLDSFVMKICEDGKIDFEKVSCKICPIAKESHCGIKENCNCYNAEEYKEIVAQKEKDTGYLRRIFTEYNLGI
ncbi:MAG: hypothetical protein Q8L29_00500 [archaeon]|nr:hypothetical protein [archaeon]